MKYFVSKSLESYCATIGANSTIGVNAQWRHLSDAIGADERFRVIKMPPLVPCVAGDTPL